MIDGPRDLEQKKFSIGLATPDDWEAIKAARVRALTEEPVIFDTTPERLEGEASIDEETWRGMLTRPNMFVVLAREGSNVVGIGTAQKFYNGPGDFDPDNWKLHTTFVEKKFRDKDMGRKILEMKINEIRRRGGKRIFASIRKDNAPMMGLVRSLGFIEATQLSDEMRMKLDKELLDPKEEKMVLDLTSLEVTL